MTTTITLSPEHGYVLATFLFSAAVNFWLTVRVGNARSKYNVQAPAAYSIELKDGKIDQNNMFNCYQRSHQNFLENYFMVMGLMFIAAIQYPVYAAVAACSMLVGRIIFSVGYTSKNPDRRFWGEPLKFLGFLALVGMASAALCQCLDFSRVDCLTNESTLFGLLVHACFVKQILYVSRSLFALPLGIELSFCLHQSEP